LNTNNKKRRAKKCAGTNANTDANPVTFVNVPKLHGRMRRDELEWHKWYGQTEKRTDGAEQQKEQAVFCVVTSKNYQV